MRTYAREQPGEAWHVVDPEPVWLVALCGRVLGSNPRERHQNWLPRHAIRCRRCREAADAEGI